MDEKRNILIDACCQAFNNPAWLPKQTPTGLVTRCNYAVTFIADRMGCKDFWPKGAKEPMLANAMIDFMDKSPDWKAIEKPKVQEFANAGCLVIAAAKANPHGHVVVIMPGLEQSSARFVSAPACVNVGGTNFIGKGVNWAFRELPGFYLWRKLL